MFRPRAEDDGEEVYWPVECLPVVPLSDEYEDDDGGGCQIVGPEGPEQE